MRFSLPVLSALAALAPLASALGHAIVENHCKDPVYLWSVGSTMGERQDIESGGVYSEEFYRDPVSGGIALKITRTEDGLFDGSPQLNYAYTLTEGGDRVFYDLSNVFGNAFEGHALIVEPTEEGCGVIDWPNGVSPGGTQVKDCVSKADIRLTLCNQE
ncbi:hypothetical protein VTO42DRAFT_8258 [Malbranchea cinnamomea]